MDEGKELTARETARRLGVTLYFVYQLLWAGKLPGRKVGKQWRIPANAVMERIKARVSHGTSRG